MVFEAYEKPVAAWLGEEYHAGERLPSLTVILRSAGCHWSRCLMCGYHRVRYPPMPEKELISRMRSQLRWIQKNFRDRAYMMVKLFTSGSFFDPGEVPPRVQEEAARLFRGKVVIAETRPEFVDTGALTDFISAIDDGTWEIPCYVAMGLETVNDAIRERSIDKGFTLEAYLEAARRAHEAGAGVKSYLLLKPLFLTEQEAIDDMRYSIDEASRWSEIVSMNPCTVQKDTELEWYWKRGAYRPPYLWSVLEILLKSPVHVLCDPVGGGTKRGPHNCGECDHGMVQAIRAYSLTASKKPLEQRWEEGCDCREEWLFVLEGERPYCMPLTR